MNPRDMLSALFPVLVLAGFFVLAAIWISRRARLREFAHRERLAMIEKGLLPPAELIGGGSPLAVPGAFDVSGPASSTPSRFRSAGVMFVGIGVAVGLIIGVAAFEPIIGLGIGGAIAALGVAMIVNGVLGERELAARPRAPAPRPHLDARE